MKKVVSLFLAAAMALSLAACSANEEKNPQGGGSSSWPNSTVTMVVPVGAGGGTDTFGRIFTKSWQDSTGQAFTVNNDATGNGTVGYESVRNAAPDGKTIMFYHSTMPIQYYQGVYDKDPADPNNFTVLANVVNDGDADVLCVPSSAPYDTLQEFVDYCKDHPGEVTFGNQNGGFGHLEALLFEARAGVDINFVDAGGQSDAIISLLGGNINATFISSDAAKQYREAGDMKCLGICSEERSKVNVPDVPTMKESGYDVVFGVVMVMMGPGNMDPELAKQINETMGKAAEDEEVKKSLANMGQGYVYKDLEESQRIWKEHCATVKEVCELAGYDVSGK